MGGWKRTLDDASWREPNGVGVHFGIGMDGSKSQYTSIFDASWANGVSGSVAKYDRSNPRLAALEKLGTWRMVAYAGTTAFALVSTVNLPNTHTISIEHEDGGKPDPIWTPEQLEASIAIKRWCLEELAREGMPMAIDENALIGHFQIDGVHRAHCPGTNWPKAAQLAALQGGTDVPIQHNRLAKWGDTPGGWRGREIKGVIVVQARKDLELPPDAKAVDIDLRVTPAPNTSSYVSIEGAPGQFCDVLDNAKRRDIITVPIAPDGTIRFLCAGTLRVEEFGSVRIWR